MSLGHLFYSKCDTEVVLRAYIAWKENALERINGIFGFAVWEEKAKRLFLARDRIGVKPLFYAIKNKQLIFASEIKTLLCHPIIEHTIDAINTTDSVRLQQLAQRYLCPEMLHTIVVKRGQVVD